MNADRFLLRLEPLEIRETPATGLTPEMVHAAEYLANGFYDGTTAALTDQSYIRQAANRPAVLELSAIQTWQAPLLQDILNRYVVGLNEEKAAAGPEFGEWFDGLIARYSQAAANAGQAGVQAQQVTALVNQFNQADAQAAAAAQSGTTGTTGTGTTGTTSFPFGTTNGTTNNFTTGTNTTPTNTGTTGTTGSTTPTTGTTTPTTGTTGTGTTGTGTTGTAPAGGFGSGTTSGSGTV